MKEITFSVIILLYNEEKTIGLVLERLFSISSHYTSEVIIIDSQSTDQTPTIVKSFQQTHKNIKLISIKKGEFNYGATRNMGVQFAKGKYLCFISGDAIPYEKNSFEYFLEDFQLDQKVVAVFGKQIPYKSTPLIQKLEFICRFEKLEKFIDNKGILIQNLKKPFLPYTNETKFFWYWLFNTFSCYKRSFLIKYPFPKVDYLEDFMLGNQILENGLTKIYDSRCSVIHSHSLSFPEYYQKQKEDFMLLLKGFNVKGQTNMGCKIKKIFELKESFIQKILYLIELLFYYFLKLIAYIDVKLRARS